MPLRAVPLTTFFRWNALGITHFIEGHEGKVLRFRSARALCAGEGQVHSTTEPQGCECRREKSAQGPHSCRDVNAARNILHRLMAVAGWVIGSKSRPGAFEGVLEDYRAGLPGEDAERYTAEGFQSCI